MLAAVGSVGGSGTPPAVSRHRRVKKPVHYPRISEDQQEGQETADDHQGDIGAVHGELLRIDSLEARPVLHQQYNNKIVILCQAFAVFHSEIRTRHLTRYNNFVIVTMRREGQKMPPQSDVNNSPTP